MNRNGQWHRNRTLLFAVVMLRSAASMVSWALFVMMVSVSVSSSVLLLDIGCLQSQLIFFLLFLINSFTVFCVQSRSVRLFLFLFRFLLLLFAFDSVNDGHSILSDFGRRFSNGRWRC